MENSGEAGRRVCSSTRKLGTFETVIGYIHSKALLEMGGGSSFVLDDQQAHGIAVLYDPFFPVAFYVPLLEYPQFRRFIFTSQSP
jgi:hypothetical protein